MEQAHTIENTRPAANLAFWGLSALLYLFASHMSLGWVSDQAGGHPALGTLLLLFVGLLSLLRWGLPVRLPKLLPCALTSFCALIGIFTFHILPQFSASVFLLGAYGFWSCHAKVSLSDWNRNLVLVALAALALPFALVPGTGLGFYLRLLTADAAAFVLAGLGHTSMGAHDVLIFDNAIAQVDIPCSGLKSLFTGTGVFLLASLILKRRPGLKWMVAYGGFIFLLLLFNVLRVTFLIWLGDIAGLYDVAERVHAGVGMVLFVLACGAAIWMFIRFVPRLEDNDEARASRVPHSAGYSLPFVLLIAAFIQAVPVSPVGMSLPAPGLADIEPIELTDVEKQFFSARDATMAGKWRFKHDGFSGSILIVRSRALNGLHAPEVCFLGNGISVDDMETRDLSGLGTYRWLSVDQTRRSAAYWMQSETGVTDDFRKRFAKYVLNGQDDWILAAILFDERHETDIPEIETLMQTLIAHYRDPDESVTP